MLPHCHLTLLFPLVTSLLVSLPICLFELNYRMMCFLSKVSMVFALFTTTLYLSLKLSYWLSPLVVACGVCYCRRCIVLLVGTLVPGRPPIIYFHMFGGLVCLMMCLILFGVAPFANTQSLALKHLQVYCTMPRFPASILRCSQWILSLTYLHAVDSMGFILVLIS